MKLALGIITALLLLPLTLALDANVIATYGTTATVEASDDEIVDFTIFLGTDPDVLDWQVLALDTNHTLTNISGLAPVTTYYYYVKSCDALDVCEMTPIATFTSSVPAVTANAYGATDSSVLLNLTSDVPVNFTIYFGIGDMSSTAAAGNLDVAVTDYRLEELQENVEYNYKVVGCTASGICGPTDPVVRQFSTGGVAPDITVLLYGVTATTASAMASSSELSTFTLTWGIGDSFSSGNMNAGTGTSTEVTISDLQPGTTYEYNMMVCDEAGMCANSNGQFTTLISNPESMSDTSGNSTNSTGGEGSSTESDSSSVPEGSSGGSGGGDCSWGYERVDDRCVRIETSGSDDIPVIVVPIPEIPDDSIEQTDAGVEEIGEGNLITGLATGGTATSSWLWFAGLSGLIAAGLGAWLYARRQ